MEQDALSESVEEMKELLQSWYRSFSFVSRLQNAVKRMESNAGPWSKSLGFVVLVMLQMKNKQK